VRKAGSARRTRGASARRAERRRAETVEVWTGSRAHRHGRLSHPACHTACPCLGRTAKKLGSRARAPYRQWKGRPYQTPMQTQGRPWQSQTHLKAAPRARAPARALRPILAPTDRALAKAARAIQARELPMRRQAAQALKAQKQRRGGTEMMMPPPPTTNFRRLTRSRRCPTGSRGRWTS
jgi:hypothetical protein